jgi:hypothetical protein
VSAAVPFLAADVIENLITASTGAVLLWTHYTVSKSRLIRNVAYNTRSWPLALAIVRRKKGPQRFNMVINSTKMHTFMAN